MPIRFRLLIYNIKACDLLIRYKGTGIPEYEISKPTPKHERCAYSRTLKKLPVSYNECCKRNFLNNAFFDKAVYHKLMKK